jgi:hypothetical protein
MHPVHKLATGYIGLPGKGSVFQIFSSSTSGSFPSLGRGGRRQGGRRGNCGCFPG